ncbi:hypothetical protein P7C70_g8385, partial [Phenoliferia sp. Uapishka_3]
MESELMHTRYHDNSRLRVVGLGQADTPFSPSAIKASMGELMEGWLKLLPKFVAPQEGEWPAPKAIHMDFACGGPMLDSMRTVLGPANVKLLFWFSAGSACFLEHFATYDFAEITQSIFEDEARRRGRSYDEILSAVAAARNGTDALRGTIKKYAGAPDMYDWERGFDSATLMQLLNLLLASLLLGAQAFAKVADGFILTDDPATAAEGVSATKGHYEKLGKETFFVGPQLHQSYWGLGEPTAIENEQVASFLASAEPKSVLFISFGSLFFPVATPGLVNSLIETLLTLDTPFPFLFALGGKMASLPAKLIERVNSSGKGLICDFWVEQRAILQSGAIGFFLSHGGWNSITESVSQGIPLIIWPANAEQPINAAVLSNQPNPVAFELLQVRCGTACAPSLRTPTRITGTEDDAVQEFKEVFKKARGDEGKVLRANVEEMAAKLRESRKVVGQAEIERLIAFCS